MTLAPTTPSVKPSPEEVYQTLLRALQRKKGFGIVFVRCSPARATRLIKEVKRDLPQKKVKNVTLTEPIDNLYTIIDQRSDKSVLNILFIQGIEKSLESYIKPGYGGDGDYYNLDTVPRILSHLNQQRENFRDRFSNLCFVFILPLFGIKYFIRRAPDFYDWSSGVFEIPTERELIEQETNQIVERFSTQPDGEIDPEECKRKILEIQSWLDEPFQNSEQKLKLLLEQGKIFADLGDFDSALSSYQQVLQIEPNYISALFNVGLNLSKLKRYEEAIESHEKVLELQPDHYQSLAQRGDALAALGRYEEAIVSYDKVLDFHADSAKVWASRGFALRRLGRNQEALDSYNKALTIEPKNCVFWNQRGINQYCMNLYKDALESFDHLIELDPDFYYVWANRGDVLESLGRCEEAIDSYDRAIEKYPDNAYAWFNRAQALCRMGRSEDGIVSYEKTIELDPDYSTAHHNRALALSGIGRYQEAVVGFRKAIELAPDHLSITSWMCLGGALRSLRRYEESLTCFDKAIELGGSGRHFEWGGRAFILLRLGRLREAILSAYKACRNFRADRGLREWLERRVAIYLRQLGLKKLIPIWVSFLNLIGWRVKNW